MFDEQRLLTLVRKIFRMRNPLDPRKKWLNLGEKIVDKSEFSIICTNIHSVDDDHFHNQLQQARHHKSHMATHFQN